MESDTTILWRHSQLKNTALDIFPLDSLFCETLFPTTSVLICCNSFSNCAFFSFSYPQVAATGFDNLNSRINFRQPPPPFLSVTSSWLRHSLFLYYLLSSRCLYSHILDDSELSQTWSQQKQLLNLFYQDFLFPYFFSLIVFLFICSKINLIFCFDHLMPFFYFIGLLVKLDIT